MTELLSLAALVVRAEEAWEPVLFGGLIPIIGALAVFFIIFYAVRDGSGDEDHEDGEE